MDGGDVVDEDAFSDTMRGLVQANCGLLPVSVSGQTDEDRRNSILCNGIPKAGGVAQSVEHRPFKPLVGGSSPPALSSCPSLPTIANDDPSDSGLAPQLGVDGPANRLAVFL